MAMYRFSKYKSTISSNGFALPTTLVVSIIMLSTLTVALSIVWASRQNLKLQYDNQSAHNATTSALNIMEGCLYENIPISSTITSARADCGITNAASGANYFILKPSYASAVGSYGFSVTTVGDAGETQRLSASSGKKGTTSGAYVKQRVVKPRPRLMQRISDRNCPIKRTLAIDARDNKTYWVQKIGDNCWMTTNLAYAGGGDNTYGDVKTIEQATSGTTYTEAKYYIPTGANPTTSPTPPSTSESGTGQYGYLYNWCAAMGNQQGTSACLNATSPLPSTTTSICPKNWRLPTQDGTTNGNEFTNLNNTVNSGLTNTDAGLLTEPWLGQRSGYWNNGFYAQGSYGTYWSSTQRNATNARSLAFGSTLVGPSNNYGKNYGFAVRCVAE